MTTGPASFDPAFGPPATQRSALQRRLPTMVSQAGILIAVVATNVAVARGWGATERGVLATTTVLGAFATAGGGLGMHDVLVWAHANATPDEQRQRWIAASIVSTGAAAVVLAGGWLVVQGDELTLFALPYALALQASRVEQGLLLGAGHWRSFEWRRLAVPAGSLCAIAIGYFAGSGNPVTWYVAGAAIAAAVVGRRAWTSLRHGFALPMGRARSLATHSSFAGILHASVARADVLLVAALAGNTDAGVYAIALALGEVVLTGPNALAFHSLREAAFGDTTSATLRLTIVSATVVAAAVTVAAAGGSVALLGEAFEEVPVVFLLLVPGFVAMSVARVELAAAMGRGDSGHVVASSLIALGVIVVGDVMTVPSAGMHGAAVVSSVAYVVLAVALLRQRPGEESAA